MSVSLTYEPSSEPLHISADEWSTPVGVGRSGGDCAVDPASRRCASDPYVPRVPICTTGPQFAATPGTNRHESGTNLAMKFTTPHDRY